MVMRKIFITKSGEETQKLGESFLKRLNLVQGSTLKNTFIFALYGNLGSGKTTFIQGFAKGLGITKRILSPTFILVRNYKIPKSSSTFYHIDLYRTNDLEDLKGLGLNELFNNPNNIIAIEWAEKMRGLLPKERIDINFEYLEENKRKIMVNKLKSC